MAFTRRKLLSFIMPVSTLGLLSKSDNVLADEKNKDNTYESNNYHKTSDHNIEVENLFTNSVRQTQNEINQQRVSVTAFGAKGNYVQGKGGTDDTNAFQLASKYCSENNGRVLIIPAGNYLITETISSEPFYMEGETGCTRIYIKGMKDKIVFDMSKNTEFIGRTIGCKNIEWITEDSDIDSVIKGPITSGEYNKSLLRYIFVNNFCHGGTRNFKGYSFCWDFSAAAWFRIGDCVGAIIENNNIQGKFDIQENPETQFNDSAFELNAEEAIMSVRMSNNNIGPIKTALTIKNNVFITAHDNDIFGTLDGVVWSGENNFNEPKFYANNINSQRNGIKCEGASYLNFSNNTIRRHRKGWKAAKDDWNGLLLSDATDIKITENTIQPDQGEGEFNGNSTSINLNKINISNIDNNFIGSGCKEGINLENCAGLNINNTSTAQNRNTDIIFKLSNNTRFISIGLYSLVSTFKGNIINKDDTIKSPITMINNHFDLQSNADVEFNLTKVNADNDMKKWRTTVGLSQLTRAIVSDNNEIINYEIITRTKQKTIEQIEFRAEKIKLNNGPDLITGQGDPNGRIAAAKGSLFIRTDSNTNSSLYVKESNSGKFGWKSK